ncbi:DnaJ homolog subfamily C member 7 [Morus notabilis]|uniref:DnaJ homolog subfamily C member 7 n=1 Tax=Morus notabilis TaxID=981085 RepID=W9QV48_9ROSA|nr:DnaJ homolog subfamily C member 7 [Morus notabilis]
MSPPAVEVGSPIDSPQPKQSAPLQNPNSMAQSQPTSLPNFTNLFSGLGEAAASGATDSARPAATWRARPRLVKVRRHVEAQNPRSRSGTSTVVGSGFNPFCENGDRANGGFMFGANRGGLGETSDGKNGEGKSDETVMFNNGKGMESAKVESVGFVFGAKKNSVKSNSCAEKERFVDNAKEVVSEEKGDTKTECELESGKFGGDFVFGCNRSGLGSNSDREKAECCEFAKDSSSEDSDKRKLETEAERTKRENLAFVFGANQNGNVDFNKSFEQSGFCSSTNVKIGQETEFRKSSCSEFVFGASWFNSESNSSSEKSGFNKKVGAAGEVDPNEKWKLDNDAGVFLFGSGSRTGFSSNKRTEENFASFNSSVDTQVHNKDPNVSVKCKYPSESDDNAARSASVSGTSAEHRLPDEMRKLNIDDSVNVSGVERTENLKTKLFSNIGAASKSRRYIKVSRGCSKVSNSSSSNISSNSSKGPCVDVKKTDGNISGSSEQSHFVFGSARNDNTTDVSGTSKSEPFIFLGGLGVSAEFGQLRKCEATDPAEPNVAFSQSSFSSNCHEFQPSVSEAAFVGVEKKDTRNSPLTDFKTPLCDPVSLKESLFPEVGSKLEFTIKNGSIEDKRLRETKRKLRKPLVKQWRDRDHASKESSYPNTSGCYSPMDLSPYRDATVNDQFSRESSAASDGSSPIDSSYGTPASDAPVPADTKEEDLVTKGKGLDSDRGDQGTKVPNEENLGYHGESSCNQKCPPISVHDFACSTAQTAQADGHSGASVASVESVGVFSSNIENKENISGMQFIVTENASGLQFTSGVEDIKGADFTFSATSSGKGRLLARKRRYIRKGRSEVVKVGSSSVQSSPLSSVSSLPNAMDKSEAGKQFMEGRSSSSAEIQETCEKWRLRGNQAYKNGDLPKAEAFYTQGIISLPSSDRSGTCLKPLLLCYSNRAAARMCLLRIREALGDCMMAAALDPNFLKVHIRAANCHLLLGDVENAQQCFKNCFETGAGVCLDRRIIIDAADGQRKAQKVIECIHQSAKLLEQKNPDAALNALEIISEALSISLYSEKLLKMKGEALIMLRRPEEAIQLCEQSLSFVEKNFASVNALADIDGSSNESYSFARLWRWWLISKSYFHLGRLEAALPLLDKLAKVRSINDGSACKNLEASTSLAVTIRDLLHHKNAGNEAFKLGKYAEAVDHYTAALSSNVESRRFAAICFCNRAAAHQALGQIADAIADCSLAIALDGNYAKPPMRPSALTLVQPISSHHGGTQAPHPLENLGLAAASTHDPTL